MKATFNLPELTALVKSVNSIAPTRDALNVLRCVMLETESTGIMRVCATDLNIRVERRAAAEVAESGQLLVNARLLAGILQKLDSDTVTISGTDDKRASIEGGYASYSLPTLPPETYPSADTPNCEDIAAVKGIPSLVRRVVFAAAAESKLPTMRCVNLIFTADGLKAAACDGSRLAVAKAESKSKTEQSILVPAASLLKLSGLVADRDELHIGVADKNVFFKKEDFVFSARLVEGRSINADSMLKSVQSVFTMLTDARAMYRAASAASSVGGEQNVFSLCFRGSSICVKCGSENGQSQQSIKAVALSGTPAGEYWYDQAQLLGCLRAMKGSLMLDVGQRGILVMRTDDLCCLQTSRRRPANAEDKAA